MPDNNIIPFDHHQRVLERIGAYLEDIEMFLDEIDQAVPLMIRALKIADDKLKRDIILLLGGFAKQQVAEPLYDMMRDPGESEEVRHAASIQLSVTGSFLEQPDALVERLIEDLKDDDPVLRANAAFALGWEGNTRAVIPLIEKLYDPESSVQQSAVNALSNLRDDRILDLMLDRLEHGPVDQKKAILFNLWRFYSRQATVLSVYRRYLTHDDPELRFDALVLFSSMIDDAAAEVDTYLTCLGDASPRVRRLALEQFEELAPTQLVVLDDKIRPLAEDPDGGVRRQALKLLSGTTGGKPKGL